MKVGRKPAGPGDRGAAKAEVKKDKKAGAPKKASKAKAGTATARRRSAETPARSGRATARRPH